MNTSDPNASTNLPEVDDFLAGFNSDGDDDVELHTSQPPAGDAGADDGAGGEADGADGAAGAQGVDTGAQANDGAANAQDDLPPDLPDHVRQLVEQERAKRAEAEAAAAKERADRLALQGRVAPVQQRLSHLENELARRGSAPAPAPAASRGPAPAATAAPTGEVAAAIDALKELEASFESEKWKRYEETWPEEAAMLRDQQLLVAKAAVQRAASIEQRLSQFESRFTSVIDPIQSEIGRAAKQRAVSELEAQHPDWHEYREPGASPKANDFWKWAEDNALTLGLDFNNTEALNARLSDQRVVAGIITLYKKTAAPAPTPPVPPAPTNPSSAVLRLSSAPNVRGAPNRSATLPIERMSPADAFAAGFNSTDDD